MLHNDLTFEHHDVTMEIGSGMSRMSVGALKKPVNEKKWLGSHDDGDRGRCQHRHFKSRSNPAPATNPNMLK